MKAKINKVVGATKAILKAILKCVPRWLLMLLEIWGAWFMAILICSAAKSLEWAWATRDILYFVSAGIVLALDIAAGFISGDISIKVKVEKLDEKE